MRVARVFSVMAMATMLAALVIVVGGAQGKSAGDNTLTDRTFIDLAKQVRPAVVSIKINAETLEKFEQWQREQQLKPRKPQQRVVPPEGLDEEQLPDWLKEFFKNLPGGPNLSGPEEELFKHPYGAGSGMIIRSDGYILTNRHVLFHPMLGSRMFNKSDITVILSEGGKERKFTGDQVKFIAADQLTDLAVLKIDAKNLPTIKWGDSNKLEVGEWVMAVGDPLELTGSVSQGIISGTGREVEIAGYQSLIQTDAVINPGNSGGPLVNLDGEVVGINMAIASTTRLWSGVGFATPSDMAHKISDDLIEHGHPVRGYIGIRMTDPDEFPALAAHEGYKEKGGVGVVTVYPNQPAGKAGLRPYDIIVEIDGKKVDSNVDVQRAITARRPGDKIEFKIFRGGKTQTFTVTAGDWPTEETLMALGAPPKTKPETGKAEETEQPQKGRIGLAVENYPETPNAPEEQRGVVIRQVRPNSPAANAELRTGDVIFDVEKERVHNTDGFQTAVKDALAKWDKTANKKEKGLLLRIRRGDQEKLVQVFPWIEE